VHVYSTEGWTTGLDTFLNCRLFYLNSLLSEGTWGVKRLMLKVPVAQRTGYGLLRIRFQTKLMGNPVHFQGQWGTM